MKCEQAQRLLMDSLMGRLEDADRRQLDEHLAGCERCRAESHNVETLWQQLGDLESTTDPVPSEKLTRRFRLALADYEADMRTPDRPRFGDWWASLWSTRPALQAAFSAALLLVGVLIGAGLTSGRATRSDVEELRAEMETMSQAVTVSLLQHQSASERLRAVSWSRMAGSDDHVLTALLEAARLDPNVNVRLAAIDALAVHANQGPIRNGLIDSLGYEQSPLVQLALLEAVAGEEGLRNGELERLIDSGEVDASVLEHFAEQAETL